MTLLIGTISDMHVVITADGLSLVNPATGAGVGSDRFQKIFPIAGHAIAFVHHGLNILGGKPICDFIGAYIETQGKALVTADVKYIAEDLRSYAEQAVQKALADRTNTGVVGFWIAGFNAARKGKPELYEICWPVSPVPCKHEGIVLGGDGQQFIMHYLSHSLGPFHPEGVSKYSVNFVRRYHEVLYKQAESKQSKVGQIIFGGHQHQLILRKTGWKWVKPPT